MVFYFFVKNALDVIRFFSVAIFEDFWLFVNLRIFAKEVVDKVRELDEEKKKTEKAFHDFLPPSVVKDIKNKKVWDLS